MRRDAENRKNPVLVEKKKCNSESQELWSRMLRITKKESVIFWRKKKMLSSCAPHIQKVLNKREREGKNDDS